MTKICCNNRFLLKHYLLYTYSNIICILLLETFWVAVKATSQKSLVLQLYFLIVPDWFFKHYIFLLIYNENNFYCVTFFKTNTWIWFNMKFFCFFKLIYLMVLLNFQALFVICTKCIQIPFTFINMESIHLHCYLKDITFTYDMIRFLSFCLAEHW